MENAFENGIPLLKIFTVRDGKSFGRNGAPFPPHEGLLSPGWTHDPSADNTFYADSVRETGFGKGGRLIGTFCPSPGKFSNRSPTPLCFTFVLIQFEL